MTMSDRRGSGNARITPASRVDDVKPLPLGALNQRGRESVADSMSSTERAAFERGYIEGEKKGRKTGFSEASQAIEQQQAQGLRSASLAATDQIQSLLATFHREFSQLEEVLADKTLDLAVTIAKYVVASEVNADRDVLLPIIRQCIEPLGEAARDLKVTVNPQDLALLEAAFEGDDRKIIGDIVTDPAIEVGGCKLESPHGLIDAQLPTRWQRTLSSIGFDE